MTIARGLTVFAALLLANVTAVSFGQTSDDASSNADAQQKREDAFVAMLSNTTLTGSFTID